MELLWKRTFRRQQMHFKDKAQARAPGLISWWLISILDSLSYDQVKGRKTYITLIFVRAQHIHLQLQIRYSSNRSLQTYQVGNLVVHHNKSFGDLLCKVDCAVILLTAINDSDELIIFLHSVVTNLQMTPCLQAVRPPGSSIPEKLTHR